jgi:voltage-gated sodium channel
MDWLRKVIHDPWTERFIVTLIIINAVTLGLETSASAMVHYGPVLIAIDRLIIAIFVVEILVRLVVQGRAFFGDGWNIFDMTVVSVAVAPATTAFSVLRALRVLRLLRMITVVPALQRVVGGLIGALPGIGSILLLIGLIFYVFGLMAVNLYGAADPAHFGTLGRALYTLFTVMTLEGWVDDVVSPLMQTRPFAWLFFIPFIVVTTFTVLNLIIGIIVNAIQEEHAQSEAGERATERALIHDETAPLLTEIKGLKAELASLRQELSSGKRGAAGPVLMPSPGNLRAGLVVGAGSDVPTGESQCAIFGPTCRSGSSCLMSRSTLRRLNSTNISSRSRTSTTSG